MSSQRLLFLTRSHVYGDGVYGHGVNGNLILMRNVVLEGEEMMHLLLETHQQKANTCQWHVHSRAAAAFGRGSLVVSMELAGAGRVMGCLKSHSYNPAPPPGPPAPRDPLWDGLTWGWGGLYASHLRCTSLTRANRSRFFDQDTTSKT